MGKKLETKAKESKENWNPRLPLTAFNHTVLVTRKRSGCLHRAARTYLNQKKLQEGWREQEPPQSQLRLDSSEVKTARGTLLLRPAPTRPARELPRHFRLPNLAWISPRAALTHNQARKETWGVGRS